MVASLGNNKIQPLEITLGIRALLSGHVPEKGKKSHNKIIMIIFVVLLLLLTSSLITVAPLLFPITNVPTNLQSIFQELKYHQYYQHLQTVNITLKQ